MQQRNAWRLSLTFQNGQVFDVLSTEDDKVVDLAMEAPQEIPGYPLVNVYIAMENHYF